MLMECLYGLTLSKYVNGEKMGKYKMAIFDKKKQDKLLPNCDNDREYVIIWMFLNTGIHPKDLGGLKLKNLDENFVIWKRAKNQKARREMIPDDIMKKLTKYVKWNARPKSRVYYWGVCKKVGERSGLKAVSPMTLRHTFCINLLREYANHPTTIDLVAKRMGCDRGVVIQNYLDLEQWTQLKK